MKQITVDIGDYLRENAVGESNSIYAEELCERFEIIPPRLREIIHKLRVSGTPICSGNNGYWYAENRDDINNTISQLQGRINRMRNVMDGLMFSRIKEFGGYASK